MMKSLTQRCLRHATMVAVLVYFIPMLHAGRAQAQAYQGFTLFNPMNSKITRLIDMQGNEVHRWSNALNGTYSAYLLENGLLLRPALNPGNQMNVPAGSGRVQKIDWDGNVVWEYTYSSSKYCMHHDVEPMPNGNVLLIAYEVKTASEASAAGRQTGVTMWPEHIVEVQPVGSMGGNIVWEWHMWDHLVQDKFPTRANYGVVSQHPELFNINMGTVTFGGDWMHMNAVNYNPDLDLIAFSSHYFNEVYVIDHSTTTAQAAGHTGGRRGKGGDILYRWGKPSNYGASGATVFDVVHCAWWVPAGLPGAGHLMAFNNGAATRRSTVVELVPPMDANGNFTLTPGSAYGPAAPSWTYSNGTTFHSAHLGGNQRLPNGNTLITEATEGFLFEVTAAGNIVWQYQNSGQIAISQRYGLDYPGLAALKDEVTSQSLPPCCYDFTVTNRNIARKLITEIQLETAPGATFLANATAPAGWTAALLAPNLLSFRSASGLLPGATLGGLIACFASETGAADATWKTYNSTTIVGSGSLQLSTACTDALDSAAVNTGISDRITCEYEWTLNNRNGAKQPISAFELAILTPGFTWSSVRCPNVPGWNAAIITPQLARYTATPGMELAIGDDAAPFIAAITPPPVSAIVAVEWSSWNGATRLTRDTVMPVCNREVPMCDSATVANAQDGSGTCSFDLTLHNSHTPSGDLDGLRLRLLTPGAVFTSGGIPLGVSMVHAFAGIPLASASSRTFPCTVDTRNVMTQIRMSWQTMRNGTVVCEDTLTLPCAPQFVARCDEFTVQKLRYCEYGAGVTNGHTPSGTLNSIRLRLLTTGTTFTSVMPASGWTVQSQTGGTVQFISALPLASGDRSDGFLFSVSKSGGGVTNAELEMTSLSQGQEICADTMTLACASFVKEQDRLLCANDDSACAVRFGFDNTHTPESAVDGLSVTVTSPGDSILDSTPPAGWVVESRQSARVLFRHSGGGIPAQQGARGLQVSFFGGADNAANFRWCTMLGGTVIDCRDSGLVCLEGETRCDSLYIRPTATACTFNAGFLNARRPAALVERCRAVIATQGAAFTLAQPPAGWRIAYQDSVNVEFSHSGGGIGSGMLQENFLLSLSPSPSGSRVQLYWSTVRGATDSCSASLSVECERQPESTDTVIFIPDPSRPCCGRLVLRNTHTPASDITSFHARTITSGAVFHASQVSAPFGWVKSASAVDASWSAAGNGLAHGAVLDSCAACFDNRGIAYADFDIAWESRAGSIATGADTMRFSCSSTLETRVLDAIPQSAYLHQNYPNPFNSRTSIRYDLHADTDVTLDLVDIHGAVLRTLAFGNRQRGSYIVEWDAADMPPGIYACRLRGAGSTLLRVMVLAR